MLAREHRLLSAGVLGAASAGLFLLSACRASFGMALSEFDAISGLEKAESWPDRVAYVHDPLRYPWLFRSLDHIGFGWIFRELEVERTPDAIENPSGFARECLEDMIAGSEGDLGSTAKVTRRLLWVAELDEEQAMNQAVAVNGMVRLMIALGSEATPRQLPDATITTEDKFTAWLATLDQGWPAKRGADFDDAARAAYVDALQQITALPHPSSAGQRALIGALDRLLELEKDRALAGETRRALLEALRHGMSMGLRRALYARAPRVREAAIRGLRRLGGPKSVPVLLNLIAKPASAARGINRYDDDRFVRLALVRICGQLAAPLVFESCDGGPAPVELLYETSYSDPDEGLRLVALDALARSLGRNSSFDDDWAERWWRDVYVPHRREAVGQ
jgi:hypothetical protein